MTASAIRSAWRWPAGLLLAEIAAIHFALVPQHLREAPYIGALFIALGAATLALAALLVVRDHAAAWTAAGAIATGAILAFVLSRSIGLPAMADDIGDWLNPLGVGALTAEAMVAAISLIVVGEVRRRRLQDASAPRAAPLATGSA